MTGVPSNIRNSRELQISKVIELVRNIDTEEVLPYAKLTDLCAMGFGCDMSEAEQQAINAARLDLPGWRELFKKRTGGRSGSGLASCSPAALCSLAAAA